MLTIFAIYWFSDQKIERSMLSIDSNKTSIICMPYCYILCFDTSIIVSYNDFSIRTPIFDFDINYERWEGK